MRFIKLEPTHHVVRVEGARTAAGDPMLRCTCADGTRVRAFANAKYGMPGMTMFVGAGYPELAALDDGEVSGWTAHPIPVILEKKGEWLNLVAVNVRADDAVADAPVVRDHGVQREYAGQRARELLSGAYSAACVIVDTETTGTNESAEIISIAVIDMEGKTLLSTRVRPRNLDAVAETSHVHGLTVADLADAPTWGEVYRLADDCLRGRVWVIYNAPFDEAMIEQACIQNDLPIIIPLATVCAMELYARYAGDWDEARMQYLNKSLSGAALVLGVHVANAHDALADCATTRAFVIADAGLFVSDDCAGHVNIVRGDQLSLSVAAASVLAKVTRDRTMSALSKESPYRYDKHKGYGTALHSRELELYGAEAHHRTSYTPVRLAIERAAYRATAN